MNLTQKIWFLITVPFVVAMVVYLVATRPFRREILLHEADREVRDDVVVLQTALTKGLVDEKTQHADLVALVESIAHAERVLGVAVYDRNGAVLARSEQAQGPRIDELARRALAARSDVTQIHEEKGKTVLEHAVPLDRVGPASGGVAVVLRDIGYVDDLLFGWNVKLAVAALLLTALMIVASRPIVRRVLGEPLDAVVHGVERVAAGDLDTEVPDARRDELGRLARAFNAMTESLRNTKVRAEEEHASRAALEERMRQIQTLAAAGEVAASLAHEIGSPLNVILGRTRMIAARPDTAEAARKDLEIVAAQTERITRVVQKLLSISRPPTSHKLEQVDLGVVVEETLAFVAPECRKRKIATQMTVDDPAPLRVLANRDQLMQIMFNLCHNAMQAQPSGGSIDVRLSRHTEPVAGSKAVEIDVSDEGPGIEPSMRGQIFDPFVTTKRGEGGTGLGLAIVAGMVREMGGRVEVDESAKGGALFRVIIPAEQSHAGSEVMA